VNLLLASAPWWLRFLAVDMLIAAVAAVGWFNGEAHGEAKLTTYQLAQTQAAVKAQAAAVTIVQQQQQRKDDALKAATARAQRAEAAASGARVVGDGMRTELAQARRDLSSASLDAVRKYAAAVNTVFGECTDAVERLARAATGHASDSLMYQQAWPTN
jgi:hypothetical protein